MLRVGAHNGFSATRPLANLGNGAGFARKEASNSMDGCMDARDRCRLGSVRDGLDPDKFRCSQASLGGATLLASVGRRKCTGKGSDQGSGRRGRRRGGGKPIGRRAGAASPAPSNRAG